MPDSFDTVLSPEEEVNYKQKFSEQDSEDYDMRGWFKANQDANMEEGQHYPDTFKKPNHMTFSDQSMYHSDENQGGRWDLLSDNKFAFFPGPTNFQHHNTQEMVDYFKKIEPNNYLVLGGN